MTTQALRRCHSANLFEAIVRRARLLRWTGCVGTPRIELNLLRAATLVVAYGRALVWERANISEPLEASS